MIHHIVLTCVQGELDRAREHLAECSGGRTRQVATERVRELQSQLQELTIQRKARVPEVRRLLQCLQNVVG